MDRTQNYKSLNVISLKEHILERHILKRTYSRWDISWNGHILERTNPLELTYPRKDISWNRQILEGTCPRTDKSQNVKYHRKTYPSMDISQKYIYLGIDISQNGQIVENNIIYSKTGNLLFLYMPHLYVQLMPNILRPWQEILSNLQEITLLSVKKMKMVHLNSQ